MLDLADLWTQGWWAYQRVCVGTQQPAMHGKVKPHLDELCDMCLSQIGTQQPAMHVKVKPHLDGLCDMCLLQVSPMLPSGRHLPTRCVIG